MTPHWQQSALHVRRERTKALQEQDSRFERQPLHPLQYRDSFEKVMESLGIPQPKGLAVTDIEEGVRVAAQNKAYRRLYSQSKQFPGYY